jgi:hypothetical protein
VEELKKGTTTGDSSSDVGAAIQAFRELHGVASHEVIQEDIDGVSLISVPGGVSLIDLTSKLDERRDGPRRINATEHAHTLDAFCELVNRHKGDGTAVWADSDAPSMTAIIDYPKESDGESGPTPAWSGHRVTYRFPFAASFARWRQAKVLAQREFLAFVQERARELVDPDDIDMPEHGTLVRDVMLDVLRASGKPRAEREEVHPRAFYGSAAHLVDAAKRMSSKTGQEVKELDRGLGGITVHFIDEKHVVGAENAREYYLVEVEVFKGSGRVTMPARLRAEATERGLFLGIELVGVDRVIEQAFANALKSVHEKTDCPVYQGAPG